MNGCVKPRTIWKAVINRMIHVYLDDYRRCPDGFVPARSAEECIMLIDSEPIDVLSLDYDLGQGQPNGLEVVRHIVAHQRYPQHIFFHTSSPAGRMQMYQLLANHAPPEVKLYNGPMPHEKLESIASRGHL
ncbi:cyclic-phosphate processing receiver domain-containing protein [Paenibacillus tarimensis]